MKKTMFYILLCIISGVLQSLSFPNIIEKGLDIHTFFFIWVAYVPLFYVFYKETGILKSALYGTLAGLTFYLLSLYWLCTLVYVRSVPVGGFAYGAWASLSFYLSLFFTLGVVLSRLLIRFSSIEGIIILPVIFVIMDYLREWVLTGFPLLTPAQSQHQFLYFLQLLKITGVYGPDFIIFFVNALIASLIINRKPKLKSISWISSISIFLILGTLTVLSNIDTGVKKEKTIKILLLQPNNDQDVFDNSNYWKDNFNLVSKLIIKSRSFRPDIIIWPETQYPGYFNLDQIIGPVISSWSPGSFNLIGSGRAEFLSKQTNLYNSAYLLNRNGRIISWYDKAHLVPFGEYMPFHKQLKFVRDIEESIGYQGWDNGTNFRPMNAGGINIGAIICFDSLFPELARSLAAKGADFIAHISYETWYGHTAATSQIFINTSMRAIENGIPIARAVSCGISGFVTPYGEIISSTKPYVKAAVTGKLKINLNRKLTFYTKYGDWFAIFSILISILILIKGIIDSIIKLIKRRTSI